jgi:hypothetical protein
METIVEYRVRRKGEYSYYANDGYSKYYQRLVMRQKRQIKTIYGIPQARAHIRELTDNDNEMAQQFIIEKRVTKVHVIKFKK